MPLLRSGRERWYSSISSKVITRSAGIQFRKRSAVTAETLRLARPRTIKPSRANTIRSITNMATNGTNGSHATSTEHDPQPNAWQNPGPAAFDFRSDVVTTPTSAMLHAIAQTTLLDDVFAEDPTTLSLEAHLATLTAHPAALLVLSGTMGNQLALRTHLHQPPHAILCDARAHILEWEAGGAASLSGALVKGVVPANGRFLTLDDVLANAVLSDDVHACPTRVVSLENTLAGMITPLDECRRISKWAREHGVKIHLDGARLWEAVAAGAGSLAEYCALFDSVSLCFSKGLGAPIGSMLVGDEAFVRKARWIRKSIGGGLRQAGVITAAARVAVDETFGKGPWGMGGKLRASHENARRIAGMWVDRGGKLAKPVETNMVWFDLEDAGWEVKEFVAVGVREGVRVLGGRLVVHYQIGEEGIGRLGRVMDVVLKDIGKGKGNGVANGTSEEEKKEAEKVMAPEME